MVYDTAGSRIILFGGADDSDSELRNDTWATTPRPTCGPNFIPRAHRRPRAQGTAWSTTLLQARCCFSEA